MRKKGVSECMVECMKIMFMMIQYSVKWGCDEITDAVQEKTGLRQGC